MLFPSLVEKSHEKHLFGFPVGNQFLEMAKGAHLIVGWSFHAVLVIPLVAVAT